MTDSSVNSGRGPGDETSLSLLFRLRRQDQAAWERMVSLYSPLIVRWCRQGGVTDADAADVGQEVFMAVSRKIQDFHRDQQGDTFRGWLRTITRNKVRDFLRARAAEPAAGGGFAPELVQPTAGDSDEERDVGERVLLYRRALELIRRDYEDRSWEAFWRVVVAGESVDDVARELAMTANAIYLVKSRILRRLRDEFVGLLDATGAAEPPAPPTDC